LSSVTVTAVIPNWNGRRYLEVLLKQIAAQTYPVSEVLIVDNGSTDGSQEFAESLGCGVIRLGANHGFAVAVNRGVQQARGEAVAILNNDVELSAEYVDTLVRAFVPEYAFVTGCIRMAAQQHKIDATFDLVARSGCAWRCGHGEIDTGVWRTAHTNYQCRPDDCYVDPSRVFSRP
jgi:GT2 family glycosyltransferase